ncbi:MAG TPA: hypothetical protein DCG24_08940 [Bacteroidetes bacterium]|nr:hypothetical protein [Bacteroidota bacterium]HAE34171.1 hypothetical protein [Bacteroidota bacterium]
MPLNNVNAECRNWQTDEPVTRVHGTIVLCRTDLLNNRTTGCFGGSAMPDASPCSSECHPERPHFFQTGMA